MMEKPRSKAIELGEEVGNEVEKRHEKKLNT
jgi:hypothetical protein